MSPADDGKNAPGNATAAWPESPGTPSGDSSGSFDHVASLCEDFAEAPPHPSGTTLGSYLARAPEAARPTLLRNLLWIEVARCRANGEPPPIDHYLARFPQFASLIRGVFADLSCASDSLPPTLPGPRGRKAPVACRLGDYRLLAEIGRGGMGVVYEALNLPRGNRVALKTLPLVDGSTLHRFKREFRAMADVNHPNLVGLHTLELDGCHWFFTMDLVEGVSFLDHVRPAGRLDAERLRAAAAQLVRAVLALHGHHIVHRDLKPSNVMVTPDGRVVVMDFGVVAELDRTGLSGTEKVAGTPRYMAPEQAAGAPATPATDWYAVGVMLYEALCGSTPFSGNMYQLLHDKQRLDAPPLPRYEAIPVDLAALSLRLLARDPASRPDAHEIVKAVASVPTAQEPAPRAPTPLVGREPHLAELWGAYHALEGRREPQAVLIRGRSGEGKTTLADHFLAPLRQAGRAAVMAGRCYDRESVPFKALDGLIDALSSYLRSLPGEDAALLMPDDIGALSRVFPVLGRVEVVARASDGRLAALDEPQVRRRAFAALRALLGRLGRRSPVVWFIDDLQWGDADSADALFEVMRPPEAPAVLFLGACRDDERRDSAFLNRWDELQRLHGVTFADREVRLGPLTEDECAELVAALAGGGEPLRRRAAELAREARGNPYLLVELVGCFDPEAGSFAPLPLNEVLAKKLGRLPAEAAGLLEVVAVSGQALAVAEASRAAGHAQPPVATVTRMRIEKLVRLVGPEDNPLLDTYHDRVRETVLGRLDEGRRRSLHLALAEALEQDAGSADLLAALAKGDRAAGPAIPRVFDLAYHYDAAGVRAKAWRYALLAAEQARRQFSLEVAASHYAVARRNAEDDAPLYRLAEGHGEALILLGRYEDALRELAVAAGCAEGAERQARVEELLGEVAFKQGAIAESVEHCERGLRRLGNWIPRTRLGLAWGLVWETAVQCLHTLFPGRLHRRPASTRQALSSRLFLRLGYSYWFCSTTKLFWSGLAAMNLAERHPPSSALAYTYGVHFAGMSEVGWYSRGLRYSDRSIELRREANDLLGLGNSYLIRGLGQSRTGLFEEACESLKQAVALLSQAGDTWEYNAACCLLSTCHYYLGDLREAREEAQRTFEACLRMGETSGAQHSLFLWAAAARGDLPFADLKSCLRPIPMDTSATVQALMAEAHWHWFHKRTGEALAVLERAWGEVRAKLLLRLDTVLSLPMLVAGLRLHADAVEGAEPGEARRLRDRAYRLARWSAWVTRFFPPVHPFALRERALLLATYGKTRKALKLADRSCAVALTHQAKHELALSRVVRARLAGRLGLPDAERELREAEAGLGALERLASPDRPS